MDEQPSVLSYGELADSVDSNRWLVEQLWTSQAVGIVGGEPKCCKSFLALDLAVSVAAGTPCLRKFPVHEPGRALVYAAEDNPSIVKQRIDGICQAAGVSPHQLDLGVIAIPRLKIDEEAGKSALVELVKAQRPRLLVLDPLVRLHSQNENAAGSVVPLLQFLRDLQRSHGVAVLVVHHARKNAKKVRAGQALRGSSEFHAWVDVTLHMGRRDLNSLDLTLSIEHRAAPAVDDMTLRLQGPGDPPALALIDKPTASGKRNGTCCGAAARVLEALKSIGEPASARRIRNACGMKTTRCCEALRQLEGQGKVLRGPDGYLLREAQEQEDGHL